MTVSNAVDCWVEVFELSHYRGRRRRLFGPSRFASLRSRTAGWGISIDSIVVGPEAHVRFYNNADPNATFLWLLPRQAFGDLVNLRIDDSVDSLEIFKSPPVPGDAGYDAYQLAMQNSQMQS
jgi:hypothetical protein